MCKRERLCGLARAHDRWKITFNSPKIFSFGKARNWLHETRQLLKHKTFPKKFRVFVRMPNWVGDVVISVPVLRTLKSSRPDVELMLLCQLQFVELLSQLNLAERFITLPEKNANDFSKFSNTESFTRMFIVFSQIPCVAMLRRT
jgi:hypothetical protein